MNLWNQLIPSSNENKDEDLRKSEETITIYLGDHKSGVDVKAYHDSVFDFLRNMIDVFGDVAEKCDCDTGEKIVLLNDWLNSMEQLKDKWFEEFKSNQEIDDDDDERV